MSYIGNEPPDIGAYGVESFDGGGASFTLSKPSTTATVLLFIDGVRQTPVDAYSVSGVTLTTTGTTPAGTDNVTVQFLGDVVDFGEPSDDSVSATKIQDDAVTTDKILDDAVTADKLANSINTEIAANTAKVTNATHTGDVTGATALTIAADAVDIAMLSATGTADATTFLRGDNAWAAAGGDNTPAFEAKMSGNQTLAYDTVVVVEFDTEVFDTDGAYDHTTNYRFTVPAGEGGKYYVWARNWIEGPAVTTVIQFWHNIRKNGDFAEGMYNEYKPKNSYGFGFTLMTSGVMELAAADYIEVIAYMESTSGSAGSIKATPMASLFGAYKLIGV